MNSVKNHWLACKGHNPSYLGTLRFNIQGCIISGLEIGLEIDGGTVAQRITGKMREYLDGEKRRCRVLQYEIHQDGLKWRIPLVTKWSPQGVGVTAWTTLPPNFDLKVETISNWSFFQKD